MTECQLALEVMTDHGLTCLDELRRLLYRLLSTRLMRNRPVGQHLPCSVCGKAYTIHRMSAFVISVCQLSASDHLQCLFISQVTQMG